MKTIRIVIVLLCLPHLAQAQSTNIRAQSGALVDCSLVVLGCEADAKSTATDTTAVTIMQVLKEISAMEQAPASPPITSWAGGTLGAMANYGTSPGAVLVPGVNAFVTNTNANGSAVSANSSPVVIASDQAAIPVTPSAGANWGIGATGSAVPANAQYIGIISGGNLTGWTGAVTVASGGIASGAIASGAIVDGADVSEGATADAAATAGSTGSVQAKLRLMTSQLATIGTNTGAPPPLGTTGGWTPTALTAITNSSQTVKGSAGQLGYVLCDNNNAAWTYLQLFNATSPSVGTNVGFIPIAPNLSGGMTLSLVGLQFSNSIKVAATTTPTGSTAPATSTINCSFGYN